MTGLSIFSGIDGMDLSFEAAGGRVVAMCEIDPYCRKILHKHCPNVPIFEDIKKMRGADIGAVDIIFGGFPCQPFSLAGKQEGQSDNRYLWPEFSRLVGEIKPLWVVAENVPGIINLAGDAVCKDLERLGYSVGIWNFEAAAVGAPHRRARVFFVAYSRCQCEGYEVSRFSRECQHSPTQGIRAKAWDGFTNCCEDVADSACAGCGCGYRRQPEPRLGGVVNGLPSWLDGAWWRHEPDIPRVAKGIPDRVNRLKALGNAVVPAQVYPIFKAIMEVEGNELFPVLLPNC